MTRNLMDDYVSIMKSVGSDDASHERIKRAVDRERARSASAPPPRLRVPPCPHEPHRHPDARPVALCASPQSPHARRCSCSVPASRSPV